MGRVLRRTRFFSRGIDEDTCPQHRQQPCHGTSPNKTTSTSTSANGPTSRVRRIRSQQRDRRASLGHSAPEQPNHELLPHRYRTQEQRHACTHHVSIGRTQIQGFS